MPQSAIDRLQTPLRNRAMEKISQNSRRLRGNSNGSFQNSLSLVGRVSSLEQLAVRLGVIPIVWIPTGTSLSATLQAMPSDRGYTASPETISVAGGTAAQVFTAAAAAAGPPAVAVAFTAGGNAQAVTATDSNDAAAKGRALVDIAP